MRALFGKSFGSSRDKMRFRSSSSDSWKHVLFSGRLLGMSRVAFTHQSSTFLRVRPRFVISDYGLDYGSVFEILHYGKALRAILLAPNVQREAVLRPTGRRGHEACMDVVLHYKRRHYWPDRECTQASSRPRLLAGTFVIRAHS